MVNELQQIENDIKIRRDFFEAKMKPLYDKRNKLQDEEIDKQNKSFLGRCFKFRNGYGGEEKWWLYYKVIGLKNGYSDLKVLSIQEPFPTGGKYIEIEIRDVHRDMLDNEISKKEFDKVYEKALLKIKEAVLNG